MAVYIVGFWSSNLGDFLDENSFCEIWLKEDKEREEKEKAERLGQSGIWGITTTVTASGYFEVEVEANSKEEAKFKAIIKKLKERVESLKKMNREQYEHNNKAAVSLNVQLSEAGNQERKFSQMIRQGEIHIVNTGHRIIGKWYKEPEVSIEIPSNGKLSAIIQAFEEAYPEEDCY